MFLSFKRGLILLYYYSKVDIDRLEPFGLEKQQIDLTDFLTCTIKVTIPLDSSSHNPFTKLIHPIPL